MPNILNDESTGASLLAILEPISNAAKPAQIDPLTLPGGDPWSRAAPTSSVSLASE